MVTYDFANQGMSFMGLKKPSKRPHIYENMTDVALHPGENEAQYQSFLQVISSLSQAFKFMPQHEQMKYQYNYPLSQFTSDPQAVHDYVESLIEAGSPIDPDHLRLEADILTGEVAGDRVAAAEELKAFEGVVFTKTASSQRDPDNPARIWGQGMGVSFSNLNFSPDASTWDLIQDNDGINSGGTSVLDQELGIGAFFDLNKLMAAGGTKSYYEIARSGAIGTSSYSKEDAFYLMASMVESRERVFSVMRDMFGEPGQLNDNNAVMNHFSEWLADYTDVDPHNISSLGMFFGMQTDFVNNLDAYINCQTYWGGNLTTPTTAGVYGSFSEDLKSKVDGYILQLQGAGETAKANMAHELEELWFNLDAAENPANNARWDSVGGQWTGQSVGTSGSWVNFFSDNMQDCVNKDVIRMVVARIMNRSSDRRFKMETEKYDEKKEDMRLEEVYLNKIAQKKRSENKRAASKMLSRKLSAAKALNKKRGKKVSGAQKSGQTAAASFAKRAKAAATTASAMGAKVSARPAAKAAAPAAAPQKKPAPQKKGVV